MFAPSIGPCEKCKVGIRLGIIETLNTAPRLLGRAGIRDEKNPVIEASGGSGEIRTHGGREPSPVFKTGALNHSATLPLIH
jgi:hypothetical protein